MAKLKPGLTRFIDGGRIELDKNTVERSIRPIALNRKIALFAGSDGGAEQNNPAELAVDEAYNISASRPIACLVGVGTVWRM